MRSAFEPKRKYRIQCEVAYPTSHFLYDGDVGGTGGAGDAGDTGGASHAGWCQVVPVVLVMLVVPRWIISYVRIMV